MMRSWSPQIIVAVFVDDADAVRIAIERDSDVRLVFVL